ncbi:hypothetical protein HYU91_04660 [Candidatus Collierbacteria bacterium]|nr:hypothetical protein [Candidatus Collierbacteria bacterium]
MKAYNFVRGHLTDGLALTTDEKLGRIVFLGEVGRGRRYEKVALDRHNPPAVVDGRVLDCQPRKVTLQPKDGKPEKIFYVLEQSRGGSDAVLVRIFTEGTYTKNTRGRWQTIAGNPETIISGYGAYGDAGRIGNWDDGLVLMRPGDVVKVTLSGGSKFEPYAIWFNDGAPQCATWKEYETLTAVTSAQAEASGSGLKILFGQMPTFTWSHGKVEPGIKLAKGLTGPMVSLGESGRGRTLTEVPLVNYPVEGKLIEAAVAVLKEETKPSRYPGGEPETKVSYGLTQGAAKEAGSGFLVKVSSSWVYTRGSSPEISAWKGNSTFLAEGRGAEGDAGRIYDWPEILVVLHEGDVLFIRPEGGYKVRSYTLFVKNGQLKTEPWVTWKVEDAKRDPEFYVAKGTAPSAGLVPAEWIGRVVSVQVLENSRDQGDHLEEKQVGEVISISPLVLNLGWDGQDRYDVTINQATWVRLERDKKVVRLGGEAAEKRQSLRARLEQLMVEAGQALAKSYTSLASEELRKELYDASRSYYWTLDTLPTEGWGNTISAFVEKAEATLKQFREVEAELQAREAAGKSGEMMPDYRVRLGGSKNGRAVETAWAILPDGSTVTPKGDYGEAIFGDLTPTALVVTHLESNYGYRYSEAWIVAHLPAKVTEAQKAKVVELGQTAHKYFVGGKTGWDLAEKEVYFQTAYDRDFRTEEELAANREMTAAFPIDLGIWKVMRSCESGKRTVWAERRTEGDSNRPSEVMAMAFKAAVAKRLDD